MENDDLRSRLLNVTALASRFCVALESADSHGSDDADSSRPFILEMLNILPRIYVEFLDLVPQNDSMSPEESYFASYVDEDYYDSIRRRVETIMGPDDIFLETFEEDMKYSDTPIAASISESLADIFQSLYNFISAVKDSEGENITEAYMQCREDFDSYWSQTLCNVLRALNNLR